MQIQVFVQKSTCKLLSVALFILLVAALLAAIHNDRKSVRIRADGLIDIQISATEYPYYMYLVDSSHDVLQTLPQSYKISYQAADLFPYDYYTFRFRYKSGQEFLIHYSPAQNIICDEYLLEPVPQLKEMLLELAAIYRQQAYSTYGALLPWEEVNQIFPMFATAKLTDIYSGESFYVQRREGVSHVDAQPLTADDTTVMKKIYHDRWSWDRKGIIVEIGGLRIAASMHGMPHGGGKIADNNFPGHFCIHFLGSIVHNGGMDIKHHREILKAAGKLPMDDED